MECVTRVFYNDLPPNSHPFHMCVCIPASLGVYAGCEFCFARIIQLLRISFDFYISCTSNYVCVEFSHPHSYTLYMIGTDIYV